jgi:hypothetical protein
MDPGGGWAGSIPDPRPGQEASEIWPKFNIIRVLGGLSLD